MMYRILLVLLLSGCGGNKTVVRHNGKIVWTITASGDKQLVEIKIGSDTLKLDSRNSSLMRDVLGVIMFKKTTETRLQ